MTTPDGFQVRRKLQTNTATPITVSSSNHSHDKADNSSRIQEGAGLLQGKVAAITGGVTGIGRAITCEYLRQGASVAVNHLDDEASAKHYTDIVRSVEEELGIEVTRRVISVPGDISKLETGQRLTSETVQRFGKIDIFVSNAGVCEFSDFLEIGPDLLSSTVSTNLTGAFFAIQAAARAMSAGGGGGSIIAVSSVSALVGGSRQAHYTPTKAGLLSLMQSCACALGPHGIRCNALLPGTVLTQLNERDLREGGDKRRYMEGRIPLGRLGEPADLAGPAVFLASDLSKYVTGAQLLVDGGLFVNLQ